VQSMRFLAAAFVLYSHHTLYVQERVDKEFPISTLGPAGVALFFMISGLVMMVTTHGFAPGIALARPFLKRRLLRILPMYWLATSLKVGVATAIPAAIVHNHIDWTFVIQSYLLIPTFNAAGFVQPFLGVGWTLMHEMYFYILFSLALLVTTRPFPLVATAVMVPVLVEWHARPGINYAAWHLASAHVNIYFVIGMAMGAAILNSGQWANTARVLLAVSMAAVGASKLIYPDFLAPFTASPPALFLAAFTLLFYASPLPKFARWSVKLGDSSYSLYLFHTFYSTAVVIALSSLLPGLSGWFYVLFGCAIGIPAGHIIYLFVEKPITKSVNRFFK